MNKSLKEDAEIRNLRPGAVLNVKLPSLKVNERFYYLERRKIEVPAIGVSEHEHLVLLEKPKGRTFAYTLDARNLRIEGDSVFEKSPFEITDFGRTHYTEDYTAEKEVIKNANRAFNV